MPPKKRATPTADDYTDIRPSRPNEPHPLAWRGVVGALDPGHVEALQRRRDRDRARWLGVGAFTRPATPAERAHVARVLGAADGHTSALRTLVLVPRSGGWHRRWPSLVDWQPETIRTTNTDKEGDAA